VATGKKLAKQVRLDERAAILRRKAEIESRNRNIVIAVFAVLIIGGSGLLYFLVNPPSLLAGPTAPTVHTAAYSVPDEGHQHISTGAPLGNSHQPPSSGSHYATPLPPGTYPIAQPAGNWVHSLEHGYIAVVYRCSGAECADLNSQAKAIMATLPKDPKYGEVKFVATPYQTMTPKIAVLAWGKEQDMDSMDQGLIAAFYAQYVNHGREDLP
jgi:Protein of unknown function (DUF3105)